MNIITKLITRSILNLHLVDSLSKCFKESDSQGLNWEGWLDFWQINKSYVFPLRLGSYLRSDCSYNSRLLVQEEKKKILSSLFRIVEEKIWWDVYNAKSQYYLYH